MSSAVRLPFLDILKALAAQLILLHHIAAYGPIAEDLEQSFPQLWSFLFHYGRMAVQLFLVVGGYLCARSFLAKPQQQIQFWSNVGKRYTRLVLPYIVALVLAVVAAGVTRHYLDADFVPHAPNLWQWLAHLSFLHSILDMPSLSSGVWYIAIDFQLFVLALGLFFISQRFGRGVAIFLAALLGIAALFYFNRFDDWDIFAPFFFAAYGLGMLVAWLERQAQKKWAVIAIMSVFAAALIYDYRLRPLLALLTGLLLLWSITYQQKTGNIIGNNPILQSLGKSAYSLFLTHFPVLMLVNALFAQLAINDPLAALMGMALIWSASLFVAGVFYRWVEAPSMNFRLSLPNAWLPLGNAPTRRR